VKSRNPASTHKKVVVLSFDRSSLQGYLNPALLGRGDLVDMLTLDGEHQSVSMEAAKAVYFVREFQQPFEPERKTFLSRPKLDGLWVRLRFRDEDEVEGIVANNLLELVDGGVRLTPPDLHGNVVRMFVPRTALLEMKVLGVVGVARRLPQVAKGAAAATSAQSKLFSE
jgi:hypothetical protein